MVPIGRPELQKLSGVAHVEGRLGVFFSLMAYTADAREWAWTVGVPLFRFSPDGTIEPTNDEAQVLFRRAYQTAAVTMTASRQVTTQAMTWAYAPACELGQAEQLLERKGGLRFRESITWVRQGWLPLGLLRVDYTRVQGQGRKAIETWTSTSVAFELVSGSAVQMPVSTVRSSKYRAVPLRSELPSEWTTSSRRFSICLAISTNSVSLPPGLHCWHSWPNTESHHRLCMGTSELHQAVMSFCRSLQDL